MSIHKHAVSEHKYHSHDDANRLGDSVARDSHRLKPDCRPPSEFQSLAMRKIRTIRSKRRLCRAHHRRPRRNNIKWNATYNQQNQPVDTTRCTFDRAPRSHSTVDPCPSSVSLGCISKVDETILNE